MRTILIIMGGYLPGCKYGGPVRSVKNLVDRLGKEYDFRILTTDRDLGDEVPYPNIVRGDWNQVGGAKVYYVEPGGFHKKIIRKLSNKADVVYLWGCFNDYARTALKLKKRGDIKCRIIIAAMGLFSPGAFHIKYPKKKAYMVLLKQLGYFKNVEWSATSEEEAEDIRREAGKDAVCRLAEDLPRRPERIEHITTTESGSLKVIFLSRISKKKNLFLAAQILQHVKGNLIFDIYGNIEDVVYWKECEKKLKKLPENIKWEYKGEADSEQVINIFSRYDVFLFPTMGENYGHVILEAMMGGCIPIISDKTPWTTEKMEKSGNVVELENIVGFQKTLQQYADMEKEILRKKKEKCLIFSEKYLREEAKKAENAYGDIFG